MIGQADLSTPLRIKDLIDKSLDMKYICYIFSDPSISIIYYIMENET